MPVRSAVSCSKPAASTRVLDCSPSRITRGEINESCSAVASIRCCCQNATPRSVRYLLLEGYFLFLVGAAMTSTSRCLRGEGRIGVVGATCNCEDWSDMVTQRRGEVSNSNRQKQFQFVPTAPPFKQDRWPPTQTGDGSADAAASVSTAAVASVRTIPVPTELEG